MAKQPKEWVTGVILLPSPACPIRGRNHKRVRFYVNRPKSERAVRKWYLEKLQASQDAQGGYPYPHLDTSVKGCFLSPEASRLFTQHKDFWKQLAADDLLRIKQERGDAESAERSRRKQAAQMRRGTAHEMGIGQSDLKRKLARFSEMIADRETIPLAVEIVRAADASFLNALLAGAQLRFAARTKAGTASEAPLSWHPGDVFQRAGVIAKKKKDDSEHLWLDKAPVSPAWPVFWLAVARSLALESTLPQFQATAVRHIGFTARTAADSEIISDVLCTMGHLEKLLIYVGDQPFNTLALPALPKLKVLVFKRAGCFDDDSDKPYDITIAGLHKHPLLQVVNIQSSARLRMADDQLSLVDRMRFESTTLRLSNSASAFTEAPPSLPSDIVSLDRNSACAFVRTATDHSQSQKKPLWWRGQWRVSKRWADLWQPTWRPWESGTGRIHLGRCEELSLEAARMLAGSGLSLLIPARCITTANASTLSAARGRLGICGIESKRVLPLDFSRLAADALCVEILGPVTCELASRLAEFKGKHLVVACAELTARPAAALAAYGGTLELAATFAGDAVAVSADTALSLTAAQGHVRFMSVDDDPRGLWIMPHEALEILERAQNVSLGDYARRVFTKTSAAGLKEIFIQLRTCAAGKRSQAEASLLECAITTRSNGLARSTVRKLGSVHSPGEWTRRLKKLCAEFEQRGFRESRSVRNSCGK